MDGTWRRSCNFCSCSSNERCWWLWLREATEAAEAVATSPRSWWWPRESKVKTLWEGHKIEKNLPFVLTKQLFLLRSVKTSGRFFQIFVASSKKVNFKRIHLFSHLSVLSSSQDVFTKTQYLCTEFSRYFYH